MFSGANADKTMNKIFLSIKGIFSYFNLISLVFSLSTSRHVRTICDTTYGIFLMMGFPYNNLKNNGIAVQPIKLPVAT